MSLSWLQANKKLIFFGFLLIILVVISISIALPLLLKGGEYVIVGGVKVPKSSYSEDTAKKKFLAELPLRSKDMVIGYNPEISKSVVTEISAKTAKDFFATKKKAIVLLKTSGILNICSYNPRFIPTNQKVRAEIKDTDIFAPGCPTF